MTCASLLIVGLLQVVMHDLRFPSHRGFAAGRHA